MEDHGGGETRSNAPFRASRYFLPALLAVPFAVGILGLVVLGPSKLIDEISNPQVKRAANAKRLTMNSYVEGDLDSYQEDVFAFELDRERRVFISVFAPFNHEVILYRAGERTSLQRDTHSGPGYNGFIDRALQPGGYHIMVKGGNREHGPYWLTVMDDARGEPETGEAAPGLKLKPGMRWAGAYACTTWRRNQQGTVTVTLKRVQGVRLEAMIATAPSRGDTLNIPVRGFADPATGRIALMPVERARPDFGGHIGVAGTLSKDRTQLDVHVRDRGCEPSMLVAASGSTERRP